MKISLKTKLTALISFLVLLVVLATSTLFISSFSRLTILAVESRGDSIAQEVYAQARAALDQRAAVPRTALRICDRPVVARSRAELPAEIGDRVFPDALLRRHY